MKYRTGFWDGKPVKTRMLELVRALGELAEPYGAWVRLHYVYPYPHVDESIAADGRGPRAAVPRRAVPARASRRAEAHEAAGQRREATSSASQRWREACPELVIRSTFIAGFPGETEAEFEHLLEFMREAQIDRAGCFAYSPVEGATRQRDRRARCRAEVREERRARFMAVAEEVSARQAARRVGATMQVLVDSAPALGRKGGVGRSLCRCAGDRRHACGCCRRRRRRKQLKVGEFTRARIVGTQGHDLVGAPMLTMSVRASERPKVD